MVTIPLLLYAILRSSTMQTYLIQKITNYISEEYNTEITIQGVDIKLFKTIVLEKLYVEDLQKDTLLYVEAFDVGIDEFKFSENKLVVGSIDLNNSTINIKVDTAGVMNFQYLIDAFMSAEEDTTSSAPWDLSVKKLSIKNANLSYHDALADTLPDSLAQKGMNFSDLSFKNTNLVVSDIVLGDTISCKLNSVSMKEKSGFLVSKITSLVKYYDTGIELQNVGIALEKSMLQAHHFTISYDSLGDFGDFMNKVKLDIDITNTRIFTSDLAYVTPLLEGYNLNLGFKGQFEGYASDLTADSVEISFENNTRLLTSFTVKGLPDINNTNFDVVIQKLSTSKSDLDKIKLPPFDANSSLPVPSQIASLGVINYSGTLKGNISHIDNKGNLITDAGNLKANAIIDYDTLTSKIDFDVQLDGENMAVNKLLGNNANYGQINLMAKLKGTNQGNSVNADVETVVSNFIFNGYTYSELELLGKITEKSFNGKVTLIDPNIMLDVNGDFYFAGDSASYVFNGSLQQAHLEKLGLDTTRKQGVLSLLFEGNMSGASLDNLNGSASILNIDYISATDTFILDELKFSAKNNPQKHLHKLNINSRLFDVSVHGDYMVADLTYSLEDFLSNYLPSVITKPELAKDRKIEESKINFDINIKQTSDLFKIFVPGLSLAEGTNFKGSYNSKGNDFSINGYSPYIAYNDQRLSQITINTNSTDNELTTTILSEKLNFTKENSLQFFELKNVLRNDSILLGIKWNSKADSIKYSGNISTISTIKNKLNGGSIIETYIKPSQIVLADSLWKISQSSVFIDSSNLLINDLEIFNRSQKIRIDGAISANDKDTLILGFNKFELNNLDLITSENGIYTVGQLNGDIKISGVYTSPYVFSEAKIDSFVLNDEFIGDVKLSGNTFKDKIMVDVAAQRLKLRTLELSGNYNLKTDSLDFELMLNKFRLEALQPYFEGVISGLDGRINSYLKIEGTTDKPKMNGILKFHKCLFTVDYTKVQYNFTDSIFITEDKFFFKNMEIFSGRSSKAFLSGEVTHDYFSNIAMDLTLDAKNFLFVDTKPGDNDMFYGTAYASGLIGIKGPLDKMVVDVNVTPKPRTHLYLPLSTASEVSENNFITFVNVDTTAKSQVEEVLSDLSSMQINMAVEMTPDAIIEMIFDETVGDKMTAQGSGAIRMEINTLGDFNMYGEYNISKGSYLFTLQNLINKYFEVKPGSTLKWNGSPYDAELDLTAVYKIKKVPLYDLILDDDFKDTKIPVDCNLSMEGNLTAPTIKFDVDLKNADEKIESQVNNLTEDDLNKQVLSLLIINKFQPLPGLSSDFISAGGVGVNTTELLSNQLSNWLSQISNDFDIGINYRPGSDISSQEVEVALSTQLWNDRVSINGNVGVEGQGASSEQSGSNLVGDFDIEVKITKNGKFRVRAFTRANNNTVYEMAPYTHGAGIFYREDFNTVSELLNKYKTTLFKPTKKSQQKEEKNKNTKNNKDAKTEEE